MSPEERQLLAELFDRIKANANAPRDAEAEAFIADKVRAQPVAPYLMAQTLIVQDFALKAANEKLQQLEARLRELEAASQKPATSFLGGLLGGGAPASAPPRPVAPPPPAYGQPQGGPWGGAPMGAPVAPAPGYAAPGGFAAPMAAQGGGFLRGALGAAAGVAGGVLLADSIRGLFHGGMGGGLGIDSGFHDAAYGGGETTIVNNYYGDGEGGGKHDAAYDAPDQGGMGAMDADYNDGGGFDDAGGFDGGDGGFDA